MSLRFRINRITKQLHSPSLLVAGSYHGGNLGDWLLYKSIERLVAKRGLRCAPALLYSINSNKLTTGLPLLLGGGNILEPNNLRQLSLYRARTRSSIAAVGVDYCDITLFKTNVPLFSEFKSIGFRSHENAQAFTNYADPIIGSRVRSSPDLVWSLVKSLNDSTRPVKAISGRCGINILPLYLKVDKDRYNLSISKADPFFEQALAETAAYLHCVCSYALSAIAAGKEVIHIPFDVSDEKLANIWLKPLGVKCAKFSCDVNSVWHLMKTCSEFVPTRFHAMIISLAAGVPCKPIPYAQKNIQLLKDVGDSSWSSRSPRYFAEAPRSMVAALTQGEPILMNDIDLDRLCLGASESIDSTLDILLNDS